MSRSGYRTLAENGTEYARRVLRGDAPLIGMPFWSFAGELGMAMRPHFFALPSLAALAGAASYSELHDPARLDDPAWFVRTAPTALICGLGWGVGQIINDLMDRESDRVNAPDRSIAAGRLPVGPALLFALALGVALAMTIFFVYRSAGYLVPIAAVLMVTYNAAKKWPIAGNVAHGCLMAVAAAIGVSAAIEPAATRQIDTIAAFPMLFMVGATAAWYLQSNYEKDRPGDRAAGYMTLAVVMPVRASAALRALGIVAIAVTARALRLLPDPVSMVTMTAGAVVGVISTIGPMIENTDAAALRAYRFAVVASILCMLSLAAPLLGRWGTTLALFVALLLVRAAFRRSDNP
jgi:4-hydroxybenzoate polyprenyltransferase